MRRFRRILGVILLGPWGLACAEDSPADTAGITIESFDDLPELTLEEDLRIGSVDDPDVGFSYVGGVVVAPDGTMYVSENADRVIRVYAATGTLLRTIGAPGEGPGEFVAIQGFGLVGDTLWVSDPGSRRISLFNLDGELLATVPAEGVDVEVAPGVTANVYPSEMRADGRFASAVGAPSFRSSDDTTYTVPRLLFDRNGAPTDTLGSMIRSVRWVFALPGAPLRVSPYYAETTFRLTVGPDSLFVEWSVEDRLVSLVRVDMGGDTLLHRWLRYTPSPVESRSRDSLVQERIRLPLLQIRANAPDSDTAGFREDVEAAMDIPTTHRPVSSVRTGADGSIWLRREDDGRGEWRWAVFDAQGRPKGSLTVPRHVRLEWMDGEYVWAIELDELDVPWLVRSRIVEGSAES